MSRGGSAPYRWHWSGPTTAGDLPKLLSREWLETNGLGGFASSTVCGANTRRYHAVLVAATDPPVGRMALVSKLQETLIEEGSLTELSTDLFGGDVVHPAGYLHLDSFVLLPAPTWTFRTAQVTLHKTVAMIQGRNLTVVRYAIPDGSAAAELQVRVLLSGRDYHAVTRANDAVNARGRVTPGLVHIPLYEGVPSVWLAHQAREFRPERTWYYNFDYPRERERGLEDREDLISAGVLQLRLDPGRVAWLAIGTDPVSPDEAAALFHRELASRETWPLSNEPDPLVAELGRATSRFLVSRGRGLKTVIAGYPWFTDWGRDTFISLPGLTLVSERFGIARQILHAFAEHVNQGITPNVFGDVTAAAQYNTIDASLWYIAAVHSYVSYTRDIELLRGGLLDVLLSIIDWHERGTRYNIRADEDGLLAGGADGVQLTWMDAKVGDQVVTPRCGKPVEISALWYNALRALEELCRALDATERAARLADKAARTRRSFNAKFWNPERNCLYDVLEHWGPDPTIRPNQLFAVSLPFAVLEADKHAAVVDTVEGKLLTPYGIRSLDPADPRYQGRFEGGPWQRDHAYHQGTVWPWLLGPFVTAYIRSRRDQVDARQRMRTQLESLGRSLTEAGLGSVCEVADGDAPHRPAGCYFQAWSVAEPLRALCEDVLGRRPHLL